MIMYETALETLAPSIRYGPDDPSAERLGQSDARLLLAVQGAGMGTWDVDWRSGTCILSRTTFGMLGLPEPDGSEGPARLSDWRALVLPEDWAELDEQIEEAAQDRTLHSGEYRIRRADTGELRWLSTHGRFFYDEAGRPLRFIGIVFDVTQRKHAEERLRQTHERLATALRVPHINLFSQDRDLRYTWLHNPALDIPVEEILGKTDRDLFRRPADAAMLEALKRSVMATGRPIRQELRLHIEGQARTFDLTLEAQRDQWGTITGVLGVALDITANKQAEFALAESEARLRLALDAGSLGVWSLDLNTDLAERSPRHDQIFGYATLEAEWSRARFMAHVLSEDRATVEAAFQKALREHAELRFACRIRRLDETVRWIEVQGSPVCTNGRVRRMVGIIGDITERKEAEAAVAESRNQLARLNRQKDTLFSIIAHDLRGPLGTVAGFADLLKQGAGRLSAAEIADHAASMVESCRQLYDLLENLLRWGRLQMGESRPEPERFSLSRLAEQASTLVKEAAERKRIAISVSVPDRTVVGDRETAATVLRNLLSNALKFTPSGGRIIIAAHLTEEAAPMVAWHVKDTGVGMTAEQTARLFHLDGRSRTQGTAGESGSGLGMHLCRDLVHSAGGSIAVDSVPGRGTDVRFTLPVTPDPGDRERRPKSPPRESRRPRHADAETTPRSGATP